MFNIRMQNKNISYNTGTYVAPELATAMLRAKLAHPDSEVVRVRQWRREQNTWVTVFETESQMQ